MARISPTTYKPILQYHFIVEFSNLELAQNNQNYARSTTLPAANNNPILIEYGNTYTYIKGKTKWNEINMTFYSLSTPDTNKIMWDWLKKHQDVIEGKDLFKDDYVADLTIKLLKPDETVAATWKLINAFASAINWGSVDWASNDVIQPEVTFVYDYAEFVERTQ